MLVETKTKDEPDEKAWKSVGFDKIFFIPAQGFVGGLCLLWKEYQLKGEKVEIIKASEIFLLMKHTNTNSNFESMIIFIYAPPNEQIKNAFWMQLKNEMMSIKIPLIVVGEYNDLMESFDKKGGATTTLNKFDKLIQFSNQFTLRDLPIKGNDFT